MNWKKDSAKNKSKLFHLPYMMLKSNSKKIKSTL